MPPACTSLPQNTHDDSESAESDKVSPLLRLDAVRRALLAANPHNANVAEIAHRFGFAELERFSETYQATFGEAPLTTLQHVPRMRPSAP